MPEKAIRDTSARLEMPSLTEGFDTLSYVIMDDNGGFTVTEWTDEV